jgi:hypothetical protein
LPITEIIGLTATTRCRQRQGRDRRAEILEAIVARLPPSTHPTSRR